MDDSVPEKFTAEEIDENIKENSRLLQIPLEVYSKILKTSLIQAEADIKGIEEGLAVKDFVKIQKLSHRIKGAYQNLRFKALGEACLKIENIAKEQGDVALMSKLHEKVKQMVASIKEYFENKEN